MPKAVTIWVEDSNICLFFARLLSYRDQKIWEIKNGFRLQLFQKSLHNQGSTSIFFCQFNPEFNDSKTRLIVYNILL